MLQINIGWFADTLLMFASWCKKFFQQSAITQMPYSTYSKITKNAFFNSFFKHGKFSKAIREKEIIIVYRTILMSKMQFFLKRYRWRQVVATSTHGQEHFQMRNWNLSPSSRSPANSSCLMTSRTTSTGQGAGRTTSLPKDPGTPAAWRRTR